MKWCLLLWGWFGLWAAPYFCIGPVHITSGGNFSGPAENIFLFLLLPSGSYYCRRVLGVTWCLLLWGWFGLWAASYFCLGLVHITSRRSFSGLAGNLIDFPLLLSGSRFPMVLIARWMVRALGGPLFVLGPSTYYIVNLKVQQAFNLETKSGSSLPEPKSVNVEQALHLQVVASGAAQKPRFFGWGL